MSVEEAAPSDADLSAVLGTADRLLREVLAEGLRPIGLSWTEYQALRHAAVRPPLVSQLAHELGSTVAMTVRLVDDLERRDLVVRRPDEHDRRTKRVEPTGLGLKTLREAQAAVAGVTAGLWAGRPRGEADQLQQLLQGLIGRVRLDRPRAAGGP